MAPGLGSADLFRMIGSFALVLAIMAGLLWALRKLQSRMNSQHPGRRMQVIESLSVGPRQKFALLRVGEHEVLVGITPTQMTSLAQWPAETSNQPSSTPSNSGSIIHATLSDTKAPHVA
jgi:flagellar protein FliO/FliZ